MTDVGARYRDERLPRYTSYPTAPHFSSEIGAADYGAWLAGLPAQARGSLYLHVPFCRAMCWYCGCNTNVALRDGPIDAYLAVLWREIDLVADCLTHPLAIGHVHFGGGTPTIVAPDAFVALAEQLRRRFDVAPDAEIAVEIDPRTLTEAMIEALAQAGVTRASLGVQSFDPMVQKAIRRVQSVAQTARAVEGLRARGIAAINFDLIYGLPHQTLGSCLDTVARCLELRPDRFSIFGYAHVPGFKKHQRRIDEAVLPGSDARHDQAQAMAQALMAAGYVRIGLDHYALPEDEMARAQSKGALRRNFQGYTTDACEALIGLGSSAIGRLRQGYVQNETVTGRYAERVGRGQLPIARGCRLSADDLLRAELIERLMCDLGVDIAEVCARHETTLAVLAPSLEQIETLAGEGLVAFDGRRLLLPESARVMVRKVASVFDAYLGQSPRRYSPSV